MSQQPHGCAGKTCSSGTSQHQNHLGAATGLLFAPLTVMKFTQGRRLTTELLRIYASTYINI